MSRGIPILTYHSQLIFGRDYADNSHVALEQDLAALARSGRRLVSLPALVAAWVAGANIDYAGIACLTFDDGPDHDWFDHDHAQHGPQPAFATLLRRHADNTGQWAGAASFVIASPEARRGIAAAALGADAMRDVWWVAAQREGMLSIESHGWDHRHPAADAQARASFLDVDDEASCARQIDHASALITRRAGGRRPRLFAYPYGESTAFLRESYLPRRGPDHGLLAACGIQGGHLHAHSSRWSLPRWVHTQHWTTPEDFDALLRA